jgi:hypothetical protein
MKKTLSVLVCFMLAFLFSRCEEQWGNDAKMAYVVDFTDNGNGQCTYHLSSSVKDHTPKYTIVAPCGEYKAGDGIFISQNINN